MVEYGIIKLFVADNTLYDKYYSTLKIDDFIKQNYPILFKLFKSLPANSLEDLEAKYLTNYPVIKDGDREVIRNLIVNIKETVSDKETIVSLLETHRGRAVASDLALAALDVAEGKRSVETLTPFIEKLNTSISVEEVLEEFVETDIESLFKEEELGGGLHWPLKCLNQAIGPLRKGNLGHIFARVETGKTAMWIHCVIHMAQQLKEGEHVVIFFNEEQGKDTIFRMYSCLTGMPYMELANNIKQAKQIWDTKIGTKIKFIDSPLKVEKRAIEGILKSLNPKLVVVDNADKIKGFNADRKDLTIHEIYKWLRDLAKTYCPVLSVGQADNTGHNSKWLDESQMADSKTSKPSELDVIIGIGRIDKDGYDDVRYINIPKNKCRGDKNTVEAMRHGKFEVLLKPALSRYEDM